jgi:L-lactate dehydrogenase complex protein LldG
VSIAKDEVLARIRVALADRHQPAGVERDYRTAGGGAEADHQSAALVELLADRLIDYRASVHHATDATVAEVIAAAILERGARRLVIPEGFPAQWLSELPANLTDQLIHDEPRLSAAELDLTDGVLTTSTVAIAETGTIVLDTSAGQGRRALTLVPDYHLCVVKAADVVRGLPEGIARLAETGTRPLTWISGPSATSDIELQRVEGVHGPRTLVVVLVS